MEDAPKCLARSFSQPASPNSSGDKKGMNTIKRALTSSISFGRFMSESLDWEKFSVFNQKRYLEEVERCSKPGSVAEKKAYFEAHYKRKRDAALLEQQNAGASNVLERNVTAKIEDSSSAGSGLGQEGCYMDMDRIREVVEDCYTVVSVGQSNSEAAIERGGGESDLGAEQVDEPLILVEDPVELINHVENDQLVALPSVEKPVVSSSKLLKNDTAIKQVPPPPPPIRPKTPALIKNREKPNTSRLNNDRDLSSKKVSTPTTLHMSMNFAPSCYGETRKTTCPDLPKNTSSTLIRTQLKKSNNSFLPRTFARASVNVLSHTPSENRTVKPNGHYSTSGSRITDSKSLSTSYSKTSNTLTNPRSTTVSSSFTFKSEERAAKRKEFFQKLERKWKPNESDKPPNTKPQVKARNSLKDHLEVSKISVVPLKPESSSSNTMKKVLKAIPCSPNIKQRSAAFRVQDNEPRPPWRFSTKADCSKDAAVKTNRPPIYSAKSFLKRSTCENSSPNVQI